MKSAQKIIDFDNESPYRPPSDISGIDFGGGIDLVGFNPDDLDLSGFDVASPPVLATRQIEDELSKPRRIMEHESGVCATHAFDLAEQIYGRGPGVTRAILAGTFIFGDFIHAMVNLAGPARVRISTLSYSAENVDALWTAFNDGKITSLDFITSDFFYSHYRTTLWRMLITSLPRDKCRYAVAGTHAKVVVIEGPEHTCVVEGSANLRSCQNVEQMLISTDDAEAVRFHAKWMDRILERFGLTWNKMRNKDVWSSTTGEEHGT
ncbi:MAG: hypothetical protein LLG20_01815 [Acidobacteriales bacterium]|nr:hypothetical protein [Terriglobales bacterium]